MGLFSWFGRKPGVQSEIERRFSEMASGRWPSDIPLTEENLQLAGKYHQVYFENFNIPIVEDADQEDWKPLSEDPELGGPAERRNRIRRLVINQPNCHRALELYRYYGAGNDFDVTLKPVDDGKPLTEDQRAVIAAAHRLWGSFLDHNFPAFSFDEWWKRTYRDGELFLYKYRKNAAGKVWPPRVRFIDPERIRDKDLNEENGIVTDPEDTGTIIEFLVTDDGEATKSLKPEQVIYLKLDTDSTSARGMSRFAGVQATAQMLRAMVRNEVIHRNLQASIVLVRKVAGGRAPALGIVDHAATGNTEYSEGPVGREKIRPGSILTVTKGVEVEFAQPSSGFSDASPLIALLIQQIAAITGWTYEQLSADTSRGNLASALVQESPTLQMILAERRFHIPFIRRLHQWVLDRAIEAGEFPEASENLWEEYESDVRYGDPVTKDPLKSAQADNLRILNQTISRAEGRRRAGVDEGRMVRELQEEKESELYMTAVANQLPDGNDMADSSQSNAQDGSGSNQGSKGEPGGHMDNQNAKGNQ